MSHPLINPGTAPSIDTSGQAVTYDDGHVHIDATPIYLAAIIAASALTLAALKQAGFRFVIGVGQ